MAELKLFKVGNKVKELKSSSATIEKELQNTIFTPLKSPAFLIKTAAARFSFRGATLPVALPHNRAVRRPPEPMLLLFCPLNTLLNTNDFHKLL